MKTDKEGLVYTDDGKLACDINAKVEEGILKELSTLGKNEVGFSVQEAEYFEAIVQEQIKHFEKKKRGTKGRKKAQQVLEEVEDGAGTEDETNSASGMD